MAEESNGSVDIIVQLFDRDYDDEDGDYEADGYGIRCMYDHRNRSAETEQDDDDGERETSIVRLPDHRSNARPLECIQKQAIQLI